MILVTGGTGTIGRAAVETLEEAGAEFRVCTRDSSRAADLEARGVQAVVADFADPASLDRAMEGVETVLLLSSQHPDQATLQGNVVEAAGRAAAQHIVKVSGGTAVTSADSGSFVGAAHLATERQIEAHGFGFTFVRPNYFLQNLLNLAKPISAGKLPVPLPDQRTAVVDARDVGILCGTVLQDPSKHAGKIYDVTGPESLSFDDVAARLASVVGHEVQHVSPPLDDAVKALAANGAPDWLQRHFREIMTVFASDPAVAEVMPTFEAVVGRPPRSIDAFAADYQAAFAA